MKIYLQFLLMSFVFAINVFAQTSAFTYQGKLTDTSAAANGQYDFTFRLFDAASGGTQIGTDFFADNVQVSGGIFTMNLDFGASSFSNGAARFLEILVRTGASTGAFTTLVPRQQITSSPFSLKSLFSTDSLQLGGIAANQFVLTGDSRLSDDRNPLPNSPNYIRNSTETQSSSNFSISGNGTAGGIFSANMINTESQFNVGGVRVLQATDNYLLLGRGISGSAGLTNATAIGNQSRVFASNTLILGSHPDFFNQSIPNTFVGIGIGIPTTKLDVAGKVLIRSNNFNSPAGGGLRGLLNVVQTGSGDADFYMQGAGNARGINFRVTSNFNQNAALNISDYDGTTYTDRLTINSDGNIGIGTNAPQTKFHVSGTGIVRARVNSDSNGGLQLTLNNQPGWSVATVSGGQFQIFNDALGANAVWIEAATNRVGIGTTAPDQLLTVNGNASKVGGGSWATFSDERLKNINGRFTRGLTELMLLNPILFEYKPDNALGLRNTGEIIGFNAQEVQKIIPEAVSLSENGYLQLNNDPILWTMLNAVKQQQTQIELQQRQIDELKQIVCELKPEASICKD